MIVFAREVFVCKVATSPRDEAANDDGRHDAYGELAARVRFVRGTEADLARLPAEHHNDEHRADFRARLARGEHWVLGLDGDEVVTYTWLHARPSCEYPYLPGCRFGLADDVGYGYDAWTPPELRGGGVRRRAFVEELAVLRGMGKRWEASFFVKHQLEGATRSLARVGIDIVPLWHVKLKADRSLAVDKLRDDPSTWPEIQR